MAADFAAQESSVKQAKAPSASLQAQSGDSRAKRDSQPTDCPQGGAASNSPHSKEPAAPPWPHQVRGSLLPAQDVHYTLA